MLQQHCVQDNISNPPNNQLLKYYKSKNYLSLIGAGTIASGSQDGAYVLSCSLCDASWRVAVIQKKCNNVVIAICRGSKLPLLTHPASVSFAWQCPCAYFPSILFHGCQVHSMPETSETAACGDVETVRMIWHGKWPNVGVPENGLNPSLCCRGVRVLWVWHWKREVLEESEDCSGERHGNVVWDKLKHFENFVKRKSVKTCFSFVATQRSAWLLQWRCLQASQYWLSYWSRVSYEVTKRTFMKGLNHAGTKQI